MEPASGHLVSIDFIDNFGLYYPTKLKYLDNQCVPVKLFGNHTYTDNIACVIVYGDKTSKCQCQNKSYVLFETFISCD